MLNNVNFHRALFDLTGSTLKVATKLLACQPVKVNKVALNFQLDDLPMKVAPIDPKPSDANRELKTTWTRAARIDK
jgi:hypothetical protein